MDKSPVIIPPGFTLPQVDLDAIAVELDRHVAGLCGARLFITGGTGFFGAWIVEPLLYFARTRGIEIRVDLLTRSANSFQAKMPRTASAPEVTIIAGDVRTLELRDTPYDLIVHAATDTSAAAGRDDPLRLADSIVVGTRNVLDLAVACGARQMLVTSSGAVYGPQPASLSHIPEDFLGWPSPAHVRSTYGEAKRYAELLCALYHEQHAVPVKIARCFAFAGPYLPLDGHFAIGNFVRDVLAGRTIEILGDGTPYRSYLYAADLAVWLWRILFEAPAGRPFNVGSEGAVSIAETARAVASAVDPPAQVTIAKTPAAGILGERYVPSTFRAREELGLGQTIWLDEAIRRMIAWHHWREAI